MRSNDEGVRDILAGDWRRPRRLPQVPVEAGMVLEEADGGFVGAVVGWSASAVTLEDRRGRRREFPYRTMVLLDGRPAVLARPAAAPACRLPQRTASGSRAVAAGPARVARASRIMVEGGHDAELVERVWGADLRVEGVVVEPLDGVDALPAVLAAFRPGPGRRLGVLVDHLVPGSKETRIVRSLQAGPAGRWLRVTGHPYVDVWQAVRPSALGIAAWPDVPRGTPWKDGVARALGTDPQTLWRRVRAAATDWTALEAPLIAAVEELVDFVTAEPAPDA